MPRFDFQGSTDYHNTSCSIVFIACFKTYVVFSFPVEENELFDFRALRLDWLRLQAYASVAKAPLSLPENRDLACLLDTVLFHTKMVDYLDEMMVETSDLSIFW